MRVLPVRMRRQTTGACGPYALAAVLLYHGVRVPVRRLAKLMGTTRAHGTKPPRLRAAARSLGFDVWVRQWAELRDLRRVLKRNRPPVVLWFSEQEGHYSVVVGLDQRFVYLADPELGRVRKLSRRFFRRCWFDFSTDGPEKRSRLYPRWMLVVEPQGLRRPC